MDPTSTCFHNGKNGMCVSVGYVPYNTERKESRSVFIFSTAMPGEQGSEEGHSREQKSPCPTVVGTEETSNRK